MPVRLALPMARISLPDRKQRMVA